MNDSHFQLLYTKLVHYGTDPFDGNARDITTGKEIDETVFNDVSKAADIENIKFKGFLQKRLVKGEVDFFSPIKKKNLQTGLRKKRMENKKISILKEDRQSFGFYWGKKQICMNPFSIPSPVFLLVSPVVMES